MRCSTRAHCGTQINSSPWFSVAYYLYMCIYYHRIPIPCSCILLPSKVVAFKCLLLTRPHSSYVIPPTKKEGSCAYKACTVSSSHHHQRHQLRVAPMKQHKHHHTSMQPHSILFYLKCFPNCVRKTQNHIAQLMWNRSQNSSSILLHCMRCCCCQLVCTLSFSLLFVTLPQARTMRCALNVAEGVSHFVKRGAKKTPYCCTSLENECHIARSLYDDDL